jgi:iron complex outermembrane receptor protein
MTTAATILAAPAFAAAQDEPATVESVVVTARDAAGLVERRPSETVFGLGKPLLETPRSASFASDTTLERYGLRTIDDLTAVAPGAFTGSYYGVPGAVNLRSTLAETYFRGFKRIENRGTYPTPIGAAERVEIVRGPPTPVYGPGKVGGFLNFVPKTAHTARGYLTQPAGEVEVEAGGYDQKRIAGRLGAPLTLGAAAEGGIYAFVEAEDEVRYYRGIHPRHLTGQLAADFDLGGGFSVAFGGMVYRSKGAVQTPGWNRVTQALIDDGLYQTGRDTTLRDADGNGRLTPNEIGAGGLIAGYFGFTPGTDPRFTLDTGLGTARLDRRTVFNSPRDFSDTTTRTGYADVAHTAGNGDVAKLQVFYDGLDNERFVSYGFPAAYDAHAVELRASYAFKRDLGELKTDTLVGAGYRRYSGRQRESFNGGNISLDRRDLTVGATPSDILDDPFSAEPGNIGLTWETDVVSRWRDAGVFVQTDLSLGPVSLTAGGRYDDYRVHGRDDGTVVFGPVPNRNYADGKGQWTYNVSLSVKAGLGLLPYVTYARSSALEVGQAGGLPPSLISAGTWLSDSELQEAGVKLNAMDGALTGALSAYRQKRTQLGQNNAVVGVRGEGVELELRWLASRQLSFTFAGNLQTTKVKGPDNSFTVIPAARAGVSGANGYGGAYAVYSFSAIQPGDYRNTLVPRSVVSLFAVYTSERHAWGRAGGALGVTRASSTRSTVPGAFRLPAYAAANASGFVERGDWKLSANIDNLTNRLYFTPVADVYANVAVLPAMGRTWRVALKRSF